jgi:hypothetical protein
MSGIINSSLALINVAIPGSATPIAGSDGTTLRFISTDSSGRQNVNINGTPTVNQGTSPWVVTGSLTGSSTSNASLATWTSATTPGTVATLINGSFIYNTVWVTLFASGTTFSASFIFNVSNDNVNWVGLSPQILDGASWGLASSPASGVNAVTLPGYTIYQLNVAGWQYCQVELSAAITGTGSPQVVIGFSTTSATGCALLPVNITQVGGVGVQGQYLPVSPGHGSTNSQTNPFFSTPCDGLNQMGAMAGFGGTAAGSRSLPVNASIYAGTTSLSATSGNLNVNLNAASASIAVTGTFWQSTQPVSGSVSVSNFPSSQAVTLASTTITGSVAVTGTFYPATQPVSIASAVTVAQATAASLNATVVFPSAQAVTLASTTVTGSVAVTGTFWQATQPVSLTSTTITGTVATTQSGTWTNTVTQATAANLNATVVFPSAQAVTLASTTVTGSVAVTGTFWQTTQPVSGTVAATQSGTWTVQQGSAPWADNLTQVGGTAFALGPATQANSLPVLGPTSSTASSPASTSVTSTSSSILASNTSRKECMIINTSTVVVYLGLGQTPTSSAYHIALSPCTGNNDGTGGTYVSDMWKGAINAITASTSSTVCVTELT